MLKAIHKDSKKLVSAWQLLKDLSWIGKEREEFIAPWSEIGNILDLQDKGIDEVKVSFVKAHTRNINGKNVLVTAHFRIETEGAIENPENESEEHKLAKETIYERILSDEIEIINFENKKISHLGEISNVYIEKKVGEKRADVLVDFKEIHPILGKGIAFEIQISPQDKARTEERTYDRSIEGYSVVWIWGFELKEFNYKVRIIPYLKALEEYKNSIKKNVQLFLSDISQRAEEKEFIIQKDIGQILERLNFKVRKINEEFENSYNSYSSKILNITNDKILEKAIEQINKVDVTQIINSYVQQYIKNDVEEKIKYKINVALKQEIREEFNNLKFDIPKEISDEYQTLFKKKMDEIDFEEFYKKNLLACFKCNSCGKILPVETTVWKKDLVANKPYCYNCYKEKEDIKDVFK